jgi:hypothetical protein
LSIPAPSANAHGPPHGGPEPLLNAVGVTRLSAITLSEIVTVAPVALPALRGRIRIPPPAAIARSGVDLFRPSRMVRRLIDTVGFANPSPIVITGPPPLMMVVAAEVPTSCTLLSIAMPPWNVPGSTRIVSPS